MRIKVENIIKLLLFLKYFFPALGVVYLVAWILQVYSENFFKFLDLFLGFLPRFADKVFLQYTDLGGKEVTLGYVYTAIFFVVFYYASNIAIKNLDKLARIQKSEETRKRLAEQEQIRKVKQLREEKKYKAELKHAKDSMIYKRCFMGLFEFKLKYFENIAYKKNPNDLEKLKEEFSRILVHKLKEKYSDVEFTVNDKIFFVCSKFQKFRAFTKDFLLLFKTFMETGLKQSIKTDMLFSYWTDEDDSKKQQIYKILCKINEFGYLNQIIVSSDLYYKLQMGEDKKSFAFMPLGTTKIMNATQNKDMDIDLYSITKLE